MYNGRAGCSKFCERASVVLRNGEWARALREQAHFAVYLHILFRSPPSGINKIINATARELRAYSASLAATRHATSTEVYAVDALR